MLKLFRHFVLAQTGRSIILGQIIKKILGPVLVLYEEQHIYLNLWSVDILSNSDEQVSQSDMQVDCLLGF